MKIKIQFQSQEEYGLLKDMEESQVGIQTFEKHEHPDHPSRLGCLCIGLTDGSISNSKEKILRKVMTVHNWVEILNVMYMFKLFGGQLS